MLRRKDRQGGLRGGWTQRRGVTGRETLTGVGVFVPGRGIGLTKRR